MSILKKPKLSIVIPAYNEEEYLPRVLDCLLNQFDNRNTPVHHSEYQIVVVNNNSNDGTVDVVKEFQKRSDAPLCFIIDEKEKGVIPARIAGFNFVLDAENNIATEYLASTDSDAILHPQWIYTIIKSFKDSDADILSFAGCYPFDFWGRIPKLTQKYLDEVGTIFFDEATINWLGIKGKKSLFTENIFHDFVRPVTDTCVAYRASAYKAAGGYTREFFDDERTKEVYGEGWRLVFKMDRLCMKHIYINNVPYIPSPRRVLKEPEKFLSGNSYNGLMQDMRGVSDDYYQTLNNLADKIDFGPGKRRYVVEYYIILRCITRPDKIKKNIQYFDGFSEEFENEIMLWWERNPKPMGRDVFNFSRELGDKYFDKIMNVFLNSELINRVVRS